MAIARRTAKKASELRVPVWVLALAYVIGFLSSAVGAADSTVKAYHDMFGGPAKTSGSIIIKKIIPNITFGSYSSRKSRPSAGPAIEDLKRRAWKPTYNGIVLELAGDFVGYAGRHCPIYWTVYDQATGNEVENKTLVSQRGYPDEDFVPPSDDAKHVLAEQWIPYPGKPGRYYVTVSVFNDVPTADNYRKIDDVDTKVYSVPPK